MLSKRDRAYLSVARYAAIRSEQKNRHGAVVVKGGRVLGIGHNKHRNHPAVIQEKDIKTSCSYHAEEVAIREAGENIKGAVIYVARVNRQGQDRDSKPCPLCSDLIQQAGIKRVIFTTEGVSQCM
jgi:deoxycytidylate deaminase